MKHAASTSLVHKVRSFARQFSDNPGAALRRLRGHFQDPLFLYQMGKVGSRTHQTTLEPYYRIFHIHTLAEFREKHAACARRIAGGDQPVDIITIAREPVGRKVSAFFQNLVGSPYRFAYRSEEEVLAAGIDELVRRFNDWRNGIREATGWYDEHFQPATGVSIYDHPFDRERGWSIIQEGRWRILVLRFSDIGSNHLEAINAFLDPRFGGRLRIDELRPCNVSGSKWYSELMREFHDRIRFDASELDEAYHSRYMRYFHSDSEIERMRSVWRAG